MSRPLRIEYKDAWYHVMNRGRRSDLIFLDDADFRYFLKLLEKASELWCVHICGYCLMPNHYHLLIQTPEANLSRFMRHVNGVYTQRFNWRHKVDGSLFRGRFKSILVGDDSYLFELLRYICFNPVKAGMVSKPEDYPWSCYQDYGSDCPQRPQHQWLKRDLILERFQLKKRRNKETVLSKDANEDIYQFFDKKRLPSLLGSKEFIDQIKNQFFERLVHHEKPASRDLAMESKQVVTLVSRAFGLDEKDIFHCRRGINNTPRDVAIYLVRKRSMCKLEEIAEIFQFANYSGVSTAIERVNQQMPIDSKLLDTINAIEKQLNKKSQKKT